MRKNQIFILLLLMLLLVFQLNAQNRQVRIACIGNSITYGDGVSNPDTQAYPAWLELRLKEVYSDSCVVKKFAVSGRTLLKHGDLPLWEEKIFSDAIDFTPDICIILLGTNDSKPQNWDKYGFEFIQDYNAMLDTFLLQNPQTLFLLCYPPPAFATKWGIRNSVILNEVIPAVDSVSHRPEAAILDFYSTLIDSSALFPDYIHPNIRGSKDMAEIAFNRLQETHAIRRVIQNLTTNVSSGRNMIEGSACSVYPNPMKDKVNVEIHSIEKGKITFRLQDIEGIPRQSYTSYSNEEENVRITLNVNSLPTGVYLYELNTKSARYNGTVLKVGF